MKDQSRTKKSDNSELRSGIVFRSTGSSYDVRFDDGSTISCKVKGRFRRMGIRTTNPVAIGDNVIAELQSDGGAYITEIAERKNYIIRRASNLSKESQILAANIDHAFLVATLKEPETTTTFIDRFLVTAEAYSIPSTILINKCDMWDNEDKELADAISYLYKSIGYDVIYCSAIEKIGIENIINETKRKISLLAGNSGVGKSSLLSALVPDLDVRIGEISQIHHTGMHTTTFSEMYALPYSGQIIDIPGVKGFGTIDMSRSEVSHYFPEIFDIGKHCRFGGCTHTHEPGCAVRQAIDEQRISQSRYASYLSILEDEEADKYRKPF